MPGTAAAAFRFSIAFQIHQPFIAFFQKSAQPIFKGQRLGSAAVHVKPAIVVVKFPLGMKLFLFRSRLCPLDRQADLPFFINR